MVNIEAEHVIIIFEVSSSYPHEISRLLDEKMRQLECEENDFKRKNKVLIASSILDYEDPNEVNTLLRASIIKYNRVIDNIQDVHRKITFEDGQQLISLLKNYQMVEVILKPNQS